MTSLTAYVEERALQLRRLTLDLIFKAGDTHTGCCLSCVDIIAALYFSDALNVSAGRPDMPERDKFILSKGHGCTTLYAALAMRGFFPKESLDDYGKDGTALAFHSTLRSLPGIEATAGSLGHGLAIGIGMALAAKKHGYLSHVYVLVGDGECQEGAIWEGAMFAGFHCMENITLIIDNNNHQTAGTTNSILDIEDLEQKFKAFRWDAVRINGHNISALINSFHRMRYCGRPGVIIADTIKGKGVSFMENKTQWHNRCPSHSEYELAKSDLDKNK